MTKDFSIVNHYPKDSDGEYLKTFMHAFQGKGTSYLIDNVDSELLLISDGEIALPLTVNDEQFSNSYVTSFYGYLLYAEEELHKLQSKLLQRLLSIALKSLSFFARLSKINRVVIINNWLLSTNLYPRIPPSKIKGLHHILNRTYPKHALVFRSLNSLQHQNLIDALQEEGYDTVCARQIWIYDPNSFNELSSVQRWNIRNDRKLLKKSAYRIIQHEEIAEENLPRLKELYDQLYLDKYTYLNPQFNLQFLKACLNQKLLKLFALEKEGKIDGVAGYFIRNGCMTTPFFGYDVGVCQKVGLYRILSSQLMALAHDKGVLLNQSAGAAHFKRQRGARGVLEYMALYKKKLPFLQKLAWSIFSLFLNTVGKYLLQKNKL